MQDKEYLLRLLSFGGSDEDGEKIASSFDSLNYVFSLDAFDMRNLSGCSLESANFLKLVAALVSRRITDEYRIGKKRSEFEMQKYLSGLFFGLSYETVYILLYDKDDKFIGSEFVGEGTVNSSTFLPRKMLDIALRRGAKSVVLAHNHPRGRAVPSENDMFATSLVSSVFENSDIKLLGHYVVAGFEVFNCLGAISDNRSARADTIELSAKIRKQLTEK